MVSNAYDKIFPDNTPSSIIKFLPEQVSLEGRREGRKLFRKLLPGTWSLPFNYRSCRSHEHGHSRETLSHRNFSRSQSDSMKV